MVTAEGLGHKHMFLNHMFKYHCFSTEIQKLGRQAMQKEIHSSQTIFSAIPFLFFPQKLHGIKTRCDGTSQPYQHKFGRDESLRLLKKTNAVGVINMSHNVVFDKLT